MGCQKNRQVTGFWWAVLVLLAVITTHIGCSPASFSKAENNEGPYVCDPFGGGNVGPLNGLQTTLAYFDDADRLAHPDWQNHVANYFSHGHISPLTMFLSQVNYPTRMFSEGFTVSGGLKVKKADGTELVEWFGLKMHSTIKLAAGDAPGAYQFGVISDDGMTMAIVGQGQVLNNDGITPPRFAYANAPVQMVVGGGLPVEILYTQGPKIWIANVLMWRAWNGSAQDPAGGVVAQYFDETTTPSTPLQPYQDLLARGWRPLRPENFWLPDGVTNPCAN